jgi:hypothetical protein
VARVWFFTRTTGLRSQCSLNPGLISIHASGVQKTAKLQPAVYDRPLLCPFSSSMACSATGGARPGRSGRL